MSSGVWNGTPIPNNTRQRLTAKQRDFLIAALIRVPALFELGKRELGNGALFDPLTEVHYSTLWAAAMAIAKQNNGQMPTNLVQAKTLLELEASTMAENAPSHVLGAGGLDALFTFDEQPGLIEWIYSLDTAVFQEAYCQDLLKNFLEERITFDPLQLMTQQCGGTVVPVNIDVKLRELIAAKERIASLGVSPISGVAFEDDEWASNAILQMPSNVAFIDAATDGGPALGEVMVLLGPTGGGKTLLGIQLAVEGARYQVRQLEAGQEAGYWYYFTYECPVKPDIRQRVVSCAAQIQWNSLKSLKSFDELSTTGALKDYELKRWKGKLDAGLQVPGERERYRAAMAEIGDRLQLVDMSGAISPSIGTRGIDEMVQYLNQEVARGRKPVGIVIDYAGIVVERMMAARNEKVDNEFAHLNRFVNNVRVELASRFNLVAWVLHQLHGEAAAASSTTRQHHSKARGARNFADNANFAFNIGTKDPSNDCCLITCSKSRRAGAIKDPPIVLIEGAFNIMKPNDGKFSLDANQRRIVDKVAAMTYVDPTSTGALIRREKNNPLSGAGDASKIY